MSYTPIDQTQEERKMRDLIEDLQVKIQQLIEFRKGGEFASQVIELKEVKSQLMREVHDLQMIQRNLLDQLSHADQSIESLKSQIVRYQKLFESRSHISPENKSDQSDVNYITVRWWDGYLEEFEAVEDRFGSDILWMRLSNGKERKIPLRMVRWFSGSKESHQKLRTSINDQASNDLQDQLSKTRPTTFDHGFDKRCDKGDSLLGILGDTYTPPTPSILSTPSNHDQGTTSAYYGYHIPKGESISPNSNPKSSPKPTGSEFYEDNFSPDMTHSRYDP